MWEQWMIDEYYGKDILDRLADEIFTQAPIKPLDTDTIYYGGIHNQVNYGRNTKQPMTIKCIKCLKDVETYSLSRKYCGSCRVNRIRYKPVDNSVDSKHTFAKIKG